MRYRLEKSDGIRALVMELVERPTLAETILHRAGPAGPASGPGPKGPGLHAIVRNPANGTAAAVYAASAGRNSTFSKAITGLSIRPSPFSSRTKP